MKFNENILYFEQFGNAKPVPIDLDTNKRGSIKKKAVYRIIVSSDRFFKFGDSSVTCANDGSEGYLLKAGQAQLISSPEKDENNKNISHIAFSIAHNKSVDNIVQVK